MISDSLRKAPAAATLLALLIFIFGITFLYRVTPSQEKITSLSILTLTALGGSARYLVVTMGQWYRIFTALLLHANVLHLFFNCYVLWYVGNLLEPLLGAAWFVAIFLISGLTAMLISTLLQPHALIVGASGGIMGLLAATFIFYALRLSHKDSGLLLRMLILSIIPMGFSRIDYIGHFFGALTGLLLGLIIHRTWKERGTDTVPFKSLALLVDLILIAITLYSFYLVAKNYQPSLQHIVNLSTT